jgi:hypothetical protein
MLYWVREVIAMSKWWSGLIDMVTNQLVVEDESAVRKRVPDLRAAVDKARRDWIMARTYFDNVTEPDLIDHAIYCIEAAEKKYMYLLKQARLQGLVMSFGELEKQVLQEAPHLHQSL